jgi:hypothetical protein
MEIEEDETEPVVYRMDVYLKEFKDVDSDRIAAFIEECAPGESPCAIQRMSAGDLPMERAFGYTLEIGEFALAFVVHDNPSPESWVIEASPFEDDVKEALLAHRAYALLVATGGEDYPSYERLLVLLKVAMALCDQGALGAGCPQTGMLHPAENLLHALEVGRDAPVEAPASLWKAVREIHQPRELLAEIMVVEMDRYTLLVTQGFAWCGFPDLIYELDDEEDPEPVVDLFDMLFDYFENAGRYRFDGRPEDLALPFQSGNALLVRWEDE